MITKYGITVVLIFLVVALFMVVGTFLVTDNRLWRGVVASFILLLALFVLYFFRDPHRIVPKDTDAIVSPADGKVVLIKECYESEYLKQPALQISVFMSPLDVHVNRFPITGIVGFYRHIEGDYIVAFDDKSSERNERTLIGIEDGDFKLLFKQIAGTVARRIVADISVGQKAGVGERFGMIRFGSRVDIIMPRNTEVSVKLNDHVRAGETIIARRTNIKEGVSA